MILFVCVGEGGCMCVSVNGWLVSSYRRKLLKGGLVYEALRDTYCLHISYDYK